MLFDKMLPQTFSTDILRATTTASADYSAEVIFLFSAFGMPNNRLDSDSLTRIDHNNLCGGESHPSLSSFIRTEFLFVVPKFTLPKTCFKTTRILPSKGTYRIILEIYTHPSFQLIYLKVFDRTESCFNQINALQGNWAKAQWAIPTTRSPAMKHYVKLVSGNLDNKTIFICCSSGRGQTYQNPMYQNETFHTACYIYW